jgi:hypothetical protein
MLRQTSGSAAPPCAAALDHAHPAGSAGTGDIHDR